VIRPSPLVQAVFRESWFEAMTSQRGTLHGRAGMQSNAPLENRVLKTAITFSNPESVPSAHRFGRALLFIGT
jgi:hypothetical protein